MVTGLRFISATLFFHTFINGQFTLSILIALFAGGTDILDGYLARKINATSNIGAYLDVLADFALVIFSFTAFIIQGWYPYWVLGIIILIFAIFIATSSIKKPVYDPVGKYLGSYLTGMIVISVLFTEDFVRQILLIVLVLMVITSMISRIIFLSRSDI